MRSRFGSWNEAVRRAGLIPVSGRTEDEIKKLIRLGMIKPFYLAHRLGMSTNQLMVSMGLAEPQKPPKERYIEEGVRIAKKLGRVPSFYDFNRNTATVSAWNPYRHYKQNWKEFASDIEATLTG